MTREEILKNAKPVLFNTEMVRAILDGRKTATRRAIKPQPSKNMSDNHNICKMPIFVDKTGKFGNLWYMDVLEQCPFRQTRYFEQFEPYSKDDYLYVRETWFNDCSRYVYKASMKQSELLQGNWRPSIHMPKEAARIFLRVKENGNQ